MKFSQYLTLFPSHFHNIFLKSFGLLLNLMINGEILQQLAIVDKISQNLWHFMKFSGILWNWILLCLLFFAFGTFKRWLQNFGFFRTYSKFQSYALFNGKSLKCLSRLPINLRKKSFFMRLTPSLVNEVFLKWLAKRLAKQQVDEMSRRHKLQQKKVL